MATYTSTPRRSVQRPEDWLNEYPERPPVYSIAQIVFKDGTTLEFMVKASPSVVSHLTKEMQNTGYLTLWNDTDTMSIASAEIKHFCLRQITNDKPSTP